MHITSAYRTRYIINKNRPSHYKPQAAEINYCVRPLHKMIICVHSNTLYKLIVQAKHKKYHLKFNHIRISMNKSSLKIVSYPKGTKIIVPTCQR